MNQDKHDNTNLEHVTCLYSEKELFLHQQWHETFLLQSQIRIKSLNLPQNTKFYRFINSPLTKTELESVFKSCFETQLVPTWQEAFTPLNDILKNDFYDAIFGKSRVIYKHQQKIAKSLSPIVASDYATLIDDLHTAIKAYFFTFLPKRKQTINNLLKQSHIQTLNPQEPFQTYLQTLQNHNLQEPNDYTRYLYPPDIFFKSKHYLKYLPTRETFPTLNQQYDQEFNIPFPPNLYSLYSA